VSETHYRFFAGKGGVGKTTCAAAFALSLARERKRTLVISTDPAHSLGDALQARLGASPRRVQPRLFAAELDADRALSRWLARREPAFRAIAARGTYLDDDDIDSLFRLSLPGVDELVALLELSRLSRGFDEVVVDTAPTGHTLRLLQMPETLSRLSDLLDDLQAKHRAMAAALRRRVRADAEDEVILELRETARHLHDLLRSPSVEFHWVTTLEEAALAEAADGVAALRSSGMVVVGVLANRATPAPPGRCGLCDTRRRNEARLLREARAALQLPVTVIEEAEVEPRGARALAEVARQLRNGRPVRRAPARPPSRRKPLPSSFHPDELLWPAGLRLLFFGGKGGVGKTTAAAAAALQAASAGRRALVLSTDPAHSLGDILRMPVGDSETQVDTGLFARELDAARSFRERRESYRAAVNELFATLRGGSSFDAPFDRAVMEDFIDLSPPGLDEIFSLLTVVDALSRHDLVIVDTAPTGHARRLLQLVPKAREWVQALLQILLKYRKLVGLGRLAEDLAGTARDLRELDGLLRDPARARFAVVTRAATLPRLETERLLRDLRALRMAAPAVLVNALTPPGCARCTRKAAAEAREVEELRATRRGKGPAWAMLGAPALAQPPLGKKALLEFGRTWTRIA
jgi:arsenite-transporting ATPase